MSLLASVRPAATTETALYAVPAAKKSVVNVTVLNTGTANARIRIGQKATNTALAAADHIYAYDLLLSPLDPPFQITGIALSALQALRVYTDVATVNFHVNGLEENA
jgi:hypothetical protein